MKHFYKGPPAAENADLARLVQDGVLEPVPSAAPTKKADKADDAREYLMSVMSEADADDLIAHRKAKKAPLSRRAAEGLVKHFAATNREFGWSVSACIDHMAAQGWRGFDVAWIRTLRGKKQQALPPAGGAMGALGRLKMRNMGDGADENGYCGADTQRLPAKQRD